MEAKKERGRGGEGVGGGFMKEKMGRFIASLSTRWQ